LNIKDIFEDRADRMAAKLAQAINDKSIVITGPYSPAVSKVADNHIRTIRICLRKDKNLPVHKKTLTGTLKAFEKENRYMGHISVNVDPA
jgi:primosomal protein N'